MTLTRLSLAQFRSWPRLDLDLGGQPLAIHGWVYSLFDGRVRELGMDVAAQDELQPSYQRALAGVPPKGKRDE